MRIYPNSPRRPHTNLRRLPPIRRRRMTPSEKLLALAAGVIILTTIVVILITTIHTLRQTHQNRRTNNRVNKLD